MSKYNECMVPAMTAIPKGITTQERRLEFCIAAKKCSKGMGREEAEAICKAQPAKPPKEPKERKHRGKKGEAECPECTSMAFIPQCELKLPGMVRTGELPADTDIPGLCQLILG